MYSHTMTQGSNNIHFSLQETSRRCKNEVTYDDLVQEVDLLEMTAAASMDDYMAMEINYQTNYTKKELERIAEYYNISKRKKRKNRLVEDIVIFEKEVENIATVYRRKKLWGYIEEIKGDKYLSKFLILD